MMIVSVAAKLYKSTVYDSRAATHLSTSDIAVPAALRIGQGLGWLSFVKYLL